MFGETISVIAFAFGCAAAVASIANLALEIRTRSRAKQALLDNLSAAPELSVVADYCGARPSDPFIETAASAMRRILSTRLEASDLKRILAGLDQENKAHQWRYIDSLIGARVRSRNGMLGLSS
jgi:hypothetical protein